jgi:hypothetical protein
MHIPKYSLPVRGRLIISMRESLSQIFQPGYVYEQVKTDDSIPAVFRDDELPVVDAVLKAIDQKG